MPIIRAIQLMITFLLIIHVVPVSAQEMTKPIDAEQWLKHSLEQYFRDSLTMKNITTERYASFKTDAMNIGMDGGMREAAFQKKWKEHYNTRSPHLNKGFLIPLQDWNEVSIQCHYVSKTLKGHWLEVVITESPNQLSFTRKIYLVYHKGNYRIDDVLEIEEKSRKNT